MKVVVQCILRNIKQMSLKPYQWGCESRGLWWLPPCALFAGKIFWIYQSFWGCHSICKQNCDQQSLGWYYNAKAKGSLGEGRVLLLGKSWKMTSRKGHRAQSNGTGCLADWSSHTDSVPSLFSSSSLFSADVSLFFHRDGKEVKTIWGDFLGATERVAEG